MQKKLLLSLLLVFTNMIYAQIRPLHIEKVADNLYTYTTYQEFQGTLYSCNALYLLTDQGVVLFDTPWDKTLNQPLLDSIQEKHQKSVIKVFATHWHNDRAGGFDFFNSLGIDTYSSARTNSILRREKLATARYEFGDEVSFSVGGETFELWFPGEGHTTDNLVVWFAKQKVLNGGCLVKSSTAKDLGFTADGDIAAWPETIKRLQQRYKKVEITIPGHDDWRQPGHIQHTLTLLKAAK
ncbi:BlaB/IND/MUS family subclass B1 metallo-beta-lactamase [Flavobacterium sp. JP2137]|uniref:BlaB/IND/MUS family subclass B1 metallo-beta-lactamase n=1 Tax=Flavobacterium sp. JP2137 TaxID=3414510 RepID=UPI003D301324